MVQVELNDMYINIGANNGSEKLWMKKNTMTSGKLIKAVYASHVYVYISISRTSWSGRLEYNSLFVGLGVWGVRGNEQKICQ